MIRPLRQLHRIVWPVISVAVAVALMLALQLKLSQSHHAQALLNPNADAALSWQWASRDGQTILRAVATNPLRSSTGVADVYTIDTNAAPPVYLASLSALLDGVPMRSPEQPLTLRIFDVANNVWLGPAFTVAER